MFFGLIEKFVNFTKFTAPGVCALGWVKCREQNFTAGYTLYNYVCDKQKILIKKKVFFFYKTDYRLW